MELNTDIAILGGGLAAYAAALEWREAGHRVTVVAKAPGASALNSGAWDLADGSPSGHGGEWAQWQGGKAALRDLLRGEEHHPYTVLSRGGSVSDLADFAETAMEKAAREIPLEMARSEQGVMALPSDLGTVKPTAWVQASMRDADLRGWNHAKVLVVGFRGFPKFKADFLRRSLLEAQERQSRVHLDFAGSLELEMPGFPGAASLQAMELAEAFEREETFRRFGEELLRYLEGRVYTQILLPPVFGLENAASRVAALAKLTVLKVAETLATPMSVPGWRLQLAFDRFWDQEPYEKIEGEAVGFDAEGRKLKALYVHRGEQRFKLRAAAFILAGGKYLGGGVRRRRQWREPVFGLPLWQGGKPLKHQAMFQMSRRHPEEFQPFLAAGVRINPFGQPLDSDGQVAYDNLFAAGGILADFNPAQRRCAAGVSIVSGALAARHAQSLLR